MVLFNAKHVVLAKRVAQVLACMGLVCVGCVLADNREVIGDPRASLNPGVGGTRV